MSETTDFPGEMVSSKTTYKHGDVPGGWFMIGLPTLRKTRSFDVKKEQDSSNRTGIVAGFKVIEPTIDGWFDGDTLW